MGGRGALGDFTHTDVIYLPKKGSNLPAMVVELKWNKTEEAAIQQIKDKKYPTILQDYVGDVLLV